MARFDRSILITFLLVIRSSFLALSVTDPLDLSALKALYESLNNPPQLVGWNWNGGDPCSDHPWIGVNCSGQSVISVNIKGLELGGLLSPQLCTLFSLKELDVSYNHIGGEIPYCLPPNASFMNVSHNSLTGPIGNVFTDMQNLEQLDLSFNHFTGDLPSSFSSLVNLHALFLQNNEFTGSVVFLANLPLTVLCLQNNHFSGYVPKQFKFISSLSMEGNQFQPGFISPLSINGSQFHPAFTSPPSSINISAESSLPSVEENIRDDPKFMPSSVQDHSNPKKRLQVGTAAGIICGFFLTALSAAIVIQIHRSYKSKLKAHKTPNEPLNVLPVTARKVCAGNLDQYTCVSTPMITTKLPSLHNVKQGRISSRKSCSWSSNLANARLFLASDLLRATKSYSKDNVIGEGPNGCVYKAEFADGQILAVKKISMVALATYEEEEFLDVVQNLTLLMHPNIITVLGYSLDQGEHILVYDYAKNGSLDDALFSSSDTRKSLSWEARVRIALGVANALEYMHCVCSPPMAHGNMKSSNILLDDELAPYVSDCGLSVLGHLINTKPKFSKVSGNSNGYAAPELGNAGADMTKCDIYSYGIVLLELLTGQRAFDSSRKKEEQLLVKWAFSRLHDSNSLERMVDREIKGTISSKILSWFADIILLCIQPLPEFRSPMSIVAESLIRLVQKMAHPHHHKNKKRRSSIDASAELNVSELSFKSTFPYFDSPSSPVSQ